MDSVLSSLGTLINNIKNLTLPGLVAAFGFAILLWPPQPIDVVMDATPSPRYAAWPETKSGLAALANTERRIRDERETKGEEKRVRGEHEEEEDNEKRVRNEKNTKDKERLARDGNETKREPGEWKNPEFGPVCNTEQRVLRQPLGLSENKPVAVANQFSLEEIQRHLQDCSDKETALSSAEQNLITDIQAEIGVLTNERDAIRDTYVGYEKSANPLRTTFLEELRQKEDEIRFKQAEIHQEEQLARERTRRSAELSHFADEIKQRLLEPGRLRPLQKFDDFLSSLGSHIVAFLSLALGWSLLFDPINRAVFGFAYDRGFDDQLDYVWWDSNSRPTRISLTNQARVEELKKVKTLYAATQPDVPGAEAEPPPPLQDHKPPTPLSILWPLGVGGVSLIALAVLMSYRLFHTPLDAPNVGICLVDDCKVLQQAPNLGLLLAGCLAATVAALSFALVVTWAWSWRKAEGRKKEVDATKPKLDAEKNKIVDEASNRKTKIESIRKEMEALNDDAALKEKERELKQLVKEDEAAKKKQEAEVKCPNSLAAQWLKIRQPEYAIGQGLITRDGYNAIRTEYYAQSTLSIGLILPLLLVMFALLATPQMGLTAPGSTLSPWVWVFFILTQTFLILVGADRRHKFDMEVETMIVSTFLKNCEAAQKTAEDTTKTPTTIDLIRQELKKAKIVQAQNLTISPSDDSTTT